MSEEELATNQQKPKSKKTALIAIIAIIVLAAIAGAYYFWTHRSQTVKTADGSTVTYSKNGNEATISSQSGDFTVGENVSVPADFPKDIPFYAKVKVTSIVTANSDFGYTATSNDVAAAILAWYKSELAKSGWTIDVETPNSLNISKGDLSGGVSVIQTGSTSTISFSTMKKTAIPYTDANGNSITYDEMIQQQKELLNSLNQ